MSANARLITENENKLRKSSAAPTGKGSQHPLLKLQQNAGNAATQQVANTSAIQAKLSVNPPGDMYEQEADQVAADIIQKEHNSVSDGGNSAGVMRQEIPEEEELLQAKHSPDVLQRQEEEEELIQAKHSPDVLQRLEDEDEFINLKSSKGEVPHVDDSLESRINAAHGGGTRLPGDVSTSFQSHMGHDLSGVRVHDGAEANTLSRSLQAEAFTTGNDIFFRSGRYNPGSEQGRELLAHEVTHVVQQGAAPAVQKEEQQS